MEDNEDEDDLAQAEVWYIREILRIIILIVIITGELKQMNDLVHELIIIKSVI